MSRKARGRYRTGFIQGKSDWVPVKIDAYNLISKPSRLLITKRRQGVANPRQKHGFIDIYLEELIKSASDRKVIQDNRRNDFYRFSPEAVDFSICGQK